MMMTTQAPKPVSKIIVAVHGIGDQIANATVQSLAFRLFDYYGKPPALPLGRFHVIGKTSPGDTGKKSPGVVLLKSPPDPDAELPAPIGFMEVYWADIPRGLVDKGFTLEDAKRWARTIVARLHIKSSQGEQLDSRQYRMLEAVLDELVDAVYVFDNICFLARHVGLFKFELKKVLDDFLNDVQIVTEFEEYRGTILDRFDEVMQIIANDPKTKDAEIYIVGHSEGSVVSFFGLLRAMSQDSMPSWVDQVRGLMTIGSPIEVHLLLWADLWKFKSPQALRAPIVWWNYLDHGDPIAYDLEKTRQWMSESGWSRCFSLGTQEKPHEAAFARYLLPGKAHIDYWQDRELFAHFIENVVELPPPEGKTSTEKAGLPDDRWYAAPIATVFPYLLVGVLMFLSVYALYTPVVNDLESMLTSFETFRNLSAFTLLMAGMTAAVRIPRLTETKYWWFAAAVFLLAAFGAAPFIIAPRTRAFMGGMLGSEFVLPGLALVATLVATVWSYKRPARGVWPLLVPGFVLAVGLALRALSTSKPEWPIVVGSIFFLYVWWLATLLFDLSFVWHSYVRWSTALQAMRRMIQDPAQRKEV